MYDNGMTQIVGNVPDGVEELVEDVVAGDVLEVLPTERETDFLRGERDDLKMDVVIEEGFVVQDLGEDGGVGWGGDDCGLDATTGGEEAGDVEQRDHVAVGH